MKRVIVFPIILFVTQLCAQMTIEITATPQLTPLLDEIYIAGDFNGWTPGSEEWKLSENTEGHWQIEIPGENNTSFAFKFTRGSWPTVEGNALGGFLPDRTATFQNGTTLQLEIAGWEDLPGNHTVTPNVYILDGDMLMPQFNRTRRIWVCLPEGYYDSEETYPVWYMHDGQNLFDMATSFAGEWQIDEHMLSNSGNPCKSIIIGIDNGGGHRMNEYAPWYNFQYDAGGEGSVYTDFLINTLKPAVDEMFRTKPGREYTCTGGSSLGGLIAMYQLLEHPEVFSRAAIFSPAFWFNQEGIMNLAENTSLPSDCYVYMIAGQNESASMIPLMNQMNGHLLAGGLSASQTGLSADPSGAHSEWWWSSVFTDVYDFLAQCDATVAVTSARESQWKLYPNPARDSIAIESPFQVKTYELFNALGQSVQKSPVQSSGNKTIIPVEALPSGRYSIRIQYEENAVNTFTELSFVKN